MVTFDLYFSWMGFGSNVDWPVAAINEDGDYH